jgi:hypothetical protein
VLPSPATAPELQPSTSAGVAATPADAGKTPIYKRWWFWTVIGVVVAGGATAAGVLATRGSSSITQSTLGEYHVLPPAR